MKIQEKLKLILEITGLSQDKLAQEIGVTFASLNRWLNNHAKPHKTQVDKINQLYFKLTGKKDFSNSLSIKKDIILNKQKKLNVNILKYILSHKDVFEDLVLNITYHTNKIEGSTLTKKETQAILFDNSNISNKSLIEHLEAKNHQAAIEYLFHYLLDNEKIDEKLILKLHSILMNGILFNAGIYRFHGVRIVGSNTPTANYIKIPNLMYNLIKKINKKEKDLIYQIAVTHAEFEKIHPFSDGNGRIGRLILIAQLLKENFAPAIIKQDLRHKYYSFLNETQLKESYSNLEEFLCDSIIFSYKLLEKNKDSH